MEQWRQQAGTSGDRAWTRTITREEIQDELMEKFNEFPGVNFNFSQLIRDNVEEALSGVKGANSVKLFGNDLKTLEEAGQRVANILETVRGIENVGLFHIVGQPNLEIQIDREPCARYGINVADVEAAVQVAIGGRAFSQMVEGEKLYDIVLRLPLELRDDPTVIARIPVDDPAAADGQPGPRIPLAQLAKIIPHKPGASYIYRENNRRFIPIKFSVRGPRPGLGDRRGPARRSTTPKTGAKLPRGLPDRVVGRVRPDAGGQRPADVDRPALDRPDHDPALHGVQLDQGRAAGHGQRGRGDDGGRLGPAADRHAVQHLGGGRVHLDLRRRRAGRRAPDLVLQPDAGRRATRSARR